MNTLKHKLSLLLAAAIFAAGSLFSADTGVFAETTTSLNLYAPDADDESESEETDNTDIEEEYIDNDDEKPLVSELAKWYATCTKVGKVLKKKGFRYSNGGCRHTLARAIRSARKCNCALYVSWCLQEYGAIKKGRTFYVKGSGKLSKSLGSKVRVIRVYKKAKDAHLKPGDVVCFTTPHTCIYGGKSKKGNRLWFDQGKIATYGNSAGAHYKSYGRRTEGYLDNRLVSYIIRIKKI